MTKELTIQKEISPIVAKATELVITTQEHVPLATEMLSQLNTSLDQINDEEERITKPLNEALKAERSRWKPVKTALTEAIVQIGSKLSTYQTNALLEATREQQRLSDRVTKGTMKAETAIKHMDTIATPDLKTKTESGSLTFRTSYRLKIIDKALIPREYLIPDEAKLLLDLKKKITISGVEIQQIQTPVNRRNNQLDAETTIKPRKI